MTNTTKKTKQKKQNLLSDRIPNRFILALGVSKRARQIKEGAVPLVDSIDESVLPVITALDEFSQDKLTVVIEEKDDQELLLDEITDFIDSSMSPPLGLGAESRSKKETSLEERLKQDRTTVSK